MDEGSLSLSGSSKRVSSLELITFVALVVLSLGVSV